MHVSRRYIRRPFPSCKCCWSSTVMTGEKMWREEYHVMQNCRGRGPLVEQFRQWQSTTQRWKVVNFALKWWRRSASLTNCALSLSHRRTHYKYSDQLSARGTGGNSFTVPSCPRLPVDRIFEEILDYKLMQLSMGRLFLFFVLSERGRLFLAR